MHKAMKNPYAIAQCGFTCNGQGGIRTRGTGITSTPV